MGDLKQPMVPPSWTVDTAGKRRAWLRRARNAIRKAGGDPENVGAAIPPNIQRLLYTNDLYLVHIPNSEDKSMALTSLTLEVRTDFVDPAKQAALEAAVCDAARSITGTAVLLQDQQVPEITLYKNTEDGSEIVDINKDGEGGA